MDADLCGQLPILSDRALRRCLASARSAGDDELASLLAEEIARRGAQDGGAAASWPAPSPGIPNPIAG